MIVETHFGGVPEPGVLLSVVALRVGKAVLIFFYLCDDVDEEMKSARSGCVLSPWLAVALADVVRTGHCGTEKAVEEEVEVRCRLTEDEVKEDVCVAKVCGDIG